MGTPIAKQKNIVVNRTAMSMLGVSRAASVQRRVGALGVGRHPENHPLDDEQEKESAADRDRQIGDAGNNDAGEVERVHHAAIDQRHLFPWSERRGPIGWSPDDLAPASTYWTAWIRLIMSANLGPYLSHTGLTASWNGFLSRPSII